MQLAHSVINCRERKRNLRRPFSPLLFIKRSHLNIKSYLNNKIAIKYYLIMCFASSLSRTFEKKTNIENDDLILLMILRTASLSSFIVSYVNVNLCCGFYGLGNNFKHANGHHINEVIDINMDIWIQSDLLRFIRRIHSFVYLLIEMYLLAIISGAFINIYKEKKLYEQFSYADMSEEHLSHWSRFAKKIWLLFFYKCPNWSTHTIK